MMARRPECIFSSVHCNRSMIYRCTPILPNFRTLKIPKKGLPKFRQGPQKFYPSPRYQTRVHIKIVYFLYQNCLFIHSKPFSTRILSNDHFWLKSIIIFSSLIKNSIFDQLKSKKKIEDHELIYETILV